MGRNVTPRPVLLGLHWFVPDFVLRDDTGAEIYNNRADPDPMAVQIEAMDPHEFQRNRNALVLHLGTQLRAKKREGDITQEEIAEALAAETEDTRDAVVAKRVKQVRGWRCGELEPKTGDELIAALKDPRVSPAEREAIIDSIHEAIGDASKLSEGLAKKSASASGSSPEASKPLPATSANGAAQGAGETGNNSIPVLPKSPTLIGGDSITAGLAISQTEMPDPGTQVVSSVARSLS